MKFKDESTLIKRLMLKYLLLLSISSAALAGPLGPSLLLFHAWDFEQCEQRMQDLVIRGAKSVNIVPTIKFLAEDKLNLDAFCYQREKCNKIVSSDIKKIENLLSACVQVAVKNELEVSFVPHVDDGLGKGIWRNNLSFNPVKKYSGFSYKEVILDPIHRIINSFKSSKTHFDFALQGEMGATVFNYPLSYLKIYNEYKKDSSPNLNIGISLNFNNIEGKNNKNLFDKESDIQQLLNQIDFLGFSAYHPIQLELSKHFDFVKLKFISEFQRRNLKLPNHLELHFSEVGLGGGTRENDGKTAATTLDQIKAAPYSGIYGAYDANKSPWQNPKFNLFRKEFYFELNDFLKIQESNNPITRAFIWNADSWDVLGIYPNAENYRDEDVYSLIFK